MSDKLNSRTQQDNPLQKFAGPTWDNSDEYPSLESPELEADLRLAVDLLSEVEALSPKISRYVKKATRLTPPEANVVVPLLQEATITGRRVNELLYNVLVFAKCIQSVDGSHEDAKAMVARVQSLQARLDQAEKPCQLLLTLTSSDVVNKYLASSEMAPYAFRLKQARRLNQQKLSLAEEDLIVGLGVDGFVSWSNLYDNISGLISCTVDADGGQQSMGITEAIALLEGANRPLRHAAHTAINDGWKQHEETCGSILNSLSGWRLEVSARRSKVEKVHFLNDALHGGRLTRRTLNAMMAAVESRKELGQRALQTQMRVLGIEDPGPWDRFAPPPADIGSTGSKSGEEDSHKLEFSAAIELIKSAFADVNPEMSDFVQMMVDNKWIDGSISRYKRPGAYCTKFAKSRNPRVYLSYTGGMKDVLTLAHEIGHAYHNWVLRDLPLVQATYPMTLAETASIFSETVVNRYMDGQSQTDEQRFLVGWDEVRHAESLLLNVSSRFTFEYDLYEKRRGGALATHEFRELMSTNWQRWYGDSLKTYDEMFWCSKLHFHLSRISFYNFPYIFGYLFALGVYGQRSDLGDDFFSSYVALLRDTGVMTTEELAQKHLGVDLESEEFWNSSLDVVQEKVENFETISKRLAL